MPKANADNGFDSNSDLADRLLHALSNPLRRRVLHCLATEPASAKTLAAEFRIPLGNVSYHLSKVLYETCKVVKIVEKNQRRGAEEKVYALRPEAYLGVKWPEIPAGLRSVAQGVALSTFMTSAIAAIEAGQDDLERPNIFSFQPVAVDHAGHQEIATAVQDLQETVKSVAQRCTTFDPASLSQVIVGIAVFDAAPRPADESA